MPLPVTNDGLGQCSSCSGFDRWCGCSQSLLQFLIWWNSEDKIHNKAQPQTPKLETLDIRYFKNWILPKKESDRNYVEMATRCEKAAPLESFWAKDPWIAHLGRVHPPQLSQPSSVCNLDWTSQIRLEKAFWRERKDQHNLPCKRGNAKARR